MKKQLIFVLLFPVVCVASSVLALPSPPRDGNDALRDSVVCLNISSYPYDQFRPWKRSGLTQVNGCGCAVGPYEVLTTAYNVTDSTNIKVRRYGQNQFIAASVKVVDYDSNLCLLELDSQAMEKPLVPVAFQTNYRKGAPVQFYRLTENNRIHSGRAYISDHKVTRHISHASHLYYMVDNVSQNVGRGELFLLENKAIGIGAWSTSDEKEGGIIPAEIIQHFLEDFRQGDYEGFPLAGFTIDPLLDPALRRYLKMPDDMKHGVYVSDVYSLGTGADSLRRGDVIIAVDGNEIDGYGRYKHPQYQQLLFHPLISSKNIGDQIDLDIWRNGLKITLKVRAQNFKASQMLVPYYEYGRQPKYIIWGGFLLQKLTRPYITNMRGKGTPLFQRYLDEMAFKPDKDRQDIVILSYTLPADINLGYQKLQQLVVKKCNGKNITAISDILSAQKLNPQKKYDVIEFEFSNPDLVIPRDGISEANALIARRYGINKLNNIPDN